MTKICNTEGDKEAFDEEKVYQSIFRPAREKGYSEGEAGELAERVVDKVQDWLDDHEDNVVTSKELRQHVLELLKEEDEDVAFMYETHLDLS